MTPPTTRPAWRELIVPLFITLVLALLPELPGLDGVVGFSRPVRMSLAVLLFASTAAARVARNGGLSALGLILASIIRAAFLVATGKPGSLMWAMSVVGLWGNARDLRAGRLAAFLSLAEPLAVAIGFRIFGPMDGLMVVPVVMVAVGPTMHFLLLRQARRIRAAEAEANRLRVAALRAEADHQRAEVLRDVHEQLGGRLREIEARVRGLEETLASGGQPALTEVSSSIRYASLELRGAIWALDPSEESWESVEPRLRRFVGDERGISFTATLPPDQRLTPADRVGLVQAVRTALAAPGTRSIEIMLRGQQLVVETV